MGLFMNKNDLGSAIGFRQCCKRVGVLGISSLFMLVPNLIVAQDDLEKTSSLPSILQFLIGDTNNDPDAVPPENTEASFDCRTPFSFTETPYRLHAPGEQNPEIVDMVMTFESSEPTFSATVAFSNGIVYNPVVEPCPARSPGLRMLTLGNGANNPLIRVVADTVNLFIFHIVVERPE